MPPMPQMPQMPAPTPPLAELLRWMAEAPAAVRADPEGIRGGRVRVRAVVADLFETLFGEAPKAPFLGAFDPAEDTKLERNRLRWVLAASQLLWHPAFRSARLDKRGAERLFVEELASLAAVAPAGELETDEERREELIRRGLRAIGLALPGEGANEAEDRLRQVDSIERRRVLLAASERERRARQVREAMARKAAEEAAAKVSRE